MLTCGECGEAWVKEDARELQSFAKANERKLEETERKLDKLISSFLDEGTARVGVAHIPFGGAGGHENRERPGGSFMFEVKPCGWQKQCEMARPESKTNGSGIGGMIRFAHDALLAHGVDQALFAMPAGRLIQAVFLI